MRYDSLAQIGWDVVGQFMLDWQRSPYLWDREIDIQVELVSRLKTVMSLTGYGEVIGRYPGAIEKSEQEIRYSRVRSCPTLRFEIEGTNRTVKPDVVIWGDLDRLEDAELDESGVKPWPIIWACEIKYMGSSASDVDKLKQLIEIGRIKYGCVLDIRWEDRPEKRSIVWERHSLKARLWSCTAFVSSGPVGAMSL